MEEVLVCIEDFSPMNYTINKGDRVTLIHYDNYKTILTHGKSIIISDKYIKKYFMNKAEVREEKINDILNG